VKGSDYGGLQSVEQQAEIRAGVAAKNAEFVLDGNHVDVAKINIIGGTNIIAFHILADFELDRIILLLVSRPQCNDQRFEFAFGG
jgi:hypothetical protein